MCDIIINFVNGATIKLGVNEDRLQELNDMMQDPNKFIKLEKGDKYNIINKDTITCMEVHKRTDKKEDSNV